MSLAVLVWWRTALGSSARDGIWRVVDGICPDWQRAKGWLTANGNALHRYGAAPSGHDREPDGAID